MATFNDLPAELIHLIAKRLAPTCCEDSKSDILNFRSIERRTWLISNQHAFHYMTLYFRNPLHESRLGKLGRLAQPDSNGCDIRRLVREVSVIAAVEVSLESTDEVLPDSFYRRKAHNIFLKFLGKSDRNIKNQERAASHLYWENFIQPYLKTHTSDEPFESRIQQDLACFTHLRTAYVDLQHDIPEWSSPAWSTMKSMGLAEEIWNFEEGCFQSLEDTDEPEDESIDYYNNGYLNLLLLDAIPSSVSCLKFLDKDLQWDLGDSKGKTFGQVTDVEGRFPPEFGPQTGDTYAVALSNFSNLETLRIAPEKLPIEDRYQALTTNRAHHPARFLGEFFELVSLPRLKTVHIDNYLMSLTAMANVFRKAERQNIVLQLREPIILRSIPTTANTSDKAEMAANMADYWIRLLQNARYDFPEYVSSGQITFTGPIRCIGIPGGQDAMDGSFWEETLNQSCVDVLEHFMRTGLGISEVRRVLCSQGVRQYRERTEYRYDILPEDERWS